MGTQVRVGQPPKWVHGIRRNHRRGSEKLGPEGGWTEVDQVLKKNRVDRKRAEAWGQGVWALEELVDQFSK